MKICKFVIDFLKSEGKLCPCTPTTLVIMVALCFEKSVSTDFQNQYEIDFFELIFRNITHSSNTQGP